LWEKTIIMSLKKYFNIQNAKQKALIASQLDEITKMADKDKDTHNKDEYNTQHESDSKCPRCGGTQVVDRIAQVIGKGSVSGSFSLGYGSVYGSSNIDTNGVNHCSKCGHEWKKYKNNYKWASDIITDYLNGLMTHFEGKYDFAEKYYIKLKPYYAETIYSLLLKHGGDTYSSTQEGMTLKLLRENFTSIFDYQSIK
jgi:DNA-directed RNA polymerase subunit M/transcription elongation factor TFIIS